MDDKARAAGFILPPSPHVEAHKKAMAFFNAMSPEERFAVFVRAGVFNEDGSLAEGFRCLTEPDIPTER